MVLLARQQEHRRLDGPEVDRRAGERDAARLLQQVPLIHVTHVIGVHHRRHAGRVGVPVEKIERRRILAEQIVTNDQMRSLARSMLKLLADCQKRLGVAKAGAKLGLPGKLLSLDATVIDLCAAVFDWAQFRTTKGAVKLHLLLDHDGYLPSYAVITEGKVHEIQVARQLKLQRGTMLVFDRGYSDYAWFQQLSEEGVHFVTRLKDNATYLVVERRPRSGEGVLADEIIVLEKQARTNADTAPFLRRVRYLDEATQRELVFLTNHLELPASTIAAVYQERWQIELLFKALKQNLRVKTFVGTTANALKTQIWTALIALLAVKFLQLQAKFPWSLSRLIALLRQQLFVYRDLWRWLESPFEPPLPLTVEDSPQLPFAWFG